MLGGSRIQHRRQRDDLHPARFHGQRRSWRRHWNVRMNSVDQRNPRRLRFVISVPERRLHTQHRRVSIPAIREGDAHIELAQVRDIGHFGHGHLQILLCVNVAAIEAQTRDGERHQRQHSTRLYLRSPRSRRLTVVRSHARYPGKRRRLPSTIISVAPFLCLNPLSLECQTSFRATSGSAMPRPDSG